MNKNDDDFDLPLHTKQFLSHFKALELLKSDGPITREWRDLIIYCLQTNSAEVVKMMAKNVEKQTSYLRKLRLSGDAISCEGNKNLDTDSPAKQ